MIHACVDALPCVDTLDLCFISNYLLPAFVPSTGLARESSVGSPSCRYPPAGAPVPAAVVQAARARRRSAISPSRRRVDERLHPQEDHAAWEVQASNQRVVCNDIEWDCTCPFHVSTKLPCQRLVVIARTGHDFIQLPRLSLLPRWPLDQAAVLAPLLATSVTDIHRAVSAMQMSNGAASGAPIPAVTSNPNFKSGKATVADFKATDGSDNATVSTPDELSADEFTGEGSGAVPAAGDGDGKQCADTNAQGRRRVLFVRLKRREHADMVVLSSTGKYWYAERTLQPLMERLANLSTARFCSELRKWESIAAGHATDVSGAVACGCNASGSEEDTCFEHCLSANDGDANADSAIEQDIRVVAADFKVDLPAQATFEEYPWYLSYASASQVPLPDLDLFEQSQQINGASEEAVAPYSTQHGVVYNEANTDATAASAVMTVVGRPEPMPRPTSWSLKSRTIVVRQKPRTITPRQLRGAPASSERRSDKLAPAHPI
ncbi:hypothetical protein PybrP1_002174 [[Pythium] brassicae (nom. inval.)]|nr:hypothetical protein PybrP1_002174 [[Pythium] brassicae (nom. inval.)]